MKYTYKIPTEIYKGKDVINNNYILLKELGKTALIVTGNKSAKLNGALLDVLTALDMCEIDYYIFDKITENPNLDEIDEGGKLGKAVKAEFVIGIGGGSVIDAAKAISIMAIQDNKSSECLFVEENLCNIPIVAVPTTAGTGSEVTQYSILTDHKTKNKRKILREVYPDIAFIDWTYTKSLDEVIRKNTALDTFTHLVEGYLNANSTYETDRLSEKGLAIWGECIDGISSGKVDDLDLERLSEASTMGGILIALNGTSIPHCMGYLLTYNKGLPHGIATACLYADYLESFKEKRKVNNIINILGFSNLKDLQKMIIRLSLNNVIIDEEEIKEYTEIVLKDKRRLKNHTEDVMFDDVYNIYYNSLIGKHRKF